MPKPVLLRASTLGLQHDIHTCDMKRSSVMGFIPANVCCLACHWKPLSGPTHQSAGPCCGALDAGQVAAADHKDVTFISRVAQGTARQQMALLQHIAAHDRIGEAVHTPW